VPVIAAGGHADASRVNVHGRGFKHALAATLVALDGGRQYLSSDC
jgi:hypothetical protein